MYSYILSIRTEFLLDVNQDLNVITGNHVEDRNRSLYVNQDLNVITGNRVE
jgi:hypothetical protein